MICYQSEPFIPPDFGWTPTNTWPCSPTPGQPPAWLIFSFNLFLCAELGFFSQLHRSCLHSLGFLESDCWRYHIDTMCFIKSAIDNGKYVYYLLSGHAYVEAWHNQGFFTKSQIYRSDRSPGQWYSKTGWLSRNEITFPPGTSDYTEYGSLEKRGLQP